MTDTRDTIRDGVRDTVRDTTNAVTGNNNTSMIALIAGGVVVLLFALYAFGAFRGPATTLGTAPVDSTSESTTTPPNATP